MARPDGGIAVVPKEIVTNIVTANPAALMRENPAALIVNNESYGRMAAFFSPAQFDPPQVVFVETFDSQHGAVNKPFVLDGMTRTKFCADNIDAITKAYPDFEFHIRNVTQSNLKNPSVVPPGETRPDQDALTMVQYLRAIIPPTVEHTQIASDRIAAHLINGWDNMVGKDIAKKYSALAALSLLGNYNINIATDAALQKNLERQQVLMAEETPAERDRLQGALVQMAQILLQTRLVRSEVTRAAFMLVSGQSQVIGGEPEARKQVYGLLHRPEVDRKLSSSFESLSQREQERDKLGKLIFEALEKAKARPNASELNNVIELALNDSVLSYEHLVQVLEDQEPIAKYDRAREQINFNWLNNTYTRTTPTEELSAVEQALIETFGRKTRLSQPDVTTAISLIGNARRTIDSALATATGIDQKRAEYISQGARAEFIDGTIANINSLVDQIRDASTTQTLSRKTQELLEAVSETTRKLNAQIAAAKIGNLVDQYAGELTEKPDFRGLRDDIVHLVLVEHRTLDQSNQTQIVMRIRDFLNLDSDLFAAVRSGEIRLATATTRQVERRRAKSATVTPTPPETTPDVPSRPYRPPVEPRRVISTTPQQLEEEQRRREETRLNLNREKLRTLANITLRNFRLIDLSPSDLNAEDKRVIDEIIKEFGKLAFDHPDTPRVMRESYPSLRRAALNQTGANIEQSLENDQRDARTGR